MVSIITPTCQVKEVIHIFSVMWCGMKGLHDSPVNGCKATVKPKIRVGPI